MLSASVLGREFELRLLQHMLNDSDLSPKIEQASTEEIWIQLSEIRYIFRHALMRDAAYSMQLRSRQRQLHQLVVEATEKLYGYELEAHYGELAHHAEQAGLKEKALSFLHLAADQARQAFQLTQSLNYLNRALALCGTSPTQLRFNLLKDLNDVFAAMGDAEAQLKTLNELDALAKEFVDRRLSLTAKILRITYHHSRGNWQEVIDLASGVSVEVGLLGDAQMVVDINHSVVQALLRLGQLDQAIQVGQQALKISVSAGLEKSQAGILNGLGLVATERFEREVANQYFQQALTLARKINDLYVEAQALNNLGNLAAQTADYVAARTYYLEALEMARKMGNRPGQGLVLSNLGWIFALLGDFETAFTYQMQALNMSREMGNFYTVSNALINLSSVSAFLGQGKQALEYAKEGLQLAKSLNDKSTEAWAYFFQGHALLLLNKPKQARPFFVSSVNIRAELNQPNLRLEALAGLAQANFSAGSLGVASQFVNEIWEAFEAGISLDGAEEPLRVYYDCFNILQASQDDRAEQFLKLGYKALLESTAGILDENTRRMVVENVPWRRAIKEFGENLANR